MLDPGKISLQFEIEWIVDKQQQKKGSKSGLLFALMGRIARGLINLYMYEAFLPTVVPKLMSVDALTAQIRFWYFVQNFEMHLSRHKHHVLLMTLLYCYK